MTLGTICLFTISRRNCCVSSLRTHERVLVDNHTFTSWPRFHLVEQFVFVLEGILEMTLPVDDETVDM